MDDGAIVYIEHIGIRFGPKDLLDRIAQGEIVDPALIYFRSVPKFETGAQKYRWLMEHLFIGVGARHPDRVEIDVHQVLSVAVDQGRREWFPVIASEAKQSRNPSAEGSLDCFAASAPRNDAGSSREVGRLPRQSL